VASSSTVATGCRFNHYGERCRTLIAEHAEERALGDILMEQLYSFVGKGWEQEDDITLLTLRRSASLS
jgi:hypothetical protein